ncbi:amino acid adenylation domain-containing protein [Streptomyces sp. NPDC056257]|uniref:amino acid adenylation domain-containing protein n=1 Tax=Streptomyces sp. NPDC056257 TaxID=3345765 RepID=UPI0035D85C9A
MDIHSPYARGERIERVIAHHAERTPGAIALRQGDRTFTYAELRQRAATMAEGLHAAGVRHGDCVPVRMERSPELVVALLAVLEAGAAYIAVDTAWPAARTDSIIRRSGASLVVSEDNYAHFAAGAPEPVSLEPLDDGGEAACVFFTSGSTGQPKGVMSPHRGTIRTLVGCPSIPLDADSVFLQSAPLPWDGLSLELWAPLLNGGCCVLLDRGHPALDSATLREAVRSGVNSLWLTSSLFNVLTEEDVEVFRGIRLLLVGGERVSPAHVRRVLTALPDLHVVNGYGPAESTIFATTHVVRAQDVVETATEVPIGRPVPRTGVALVTPSGERAKPGDIGEIAISGDGLALRYLADPEATARAFFELDGVRHYRTGDLAILDEDGNYRYRGRADREFKVRGVRIAPGEVEKALEAHSNVATCCVLRIETTPGRPELACAYTTLDEAPLDPRELREFAARTLLGSMVPTRLLHLRRLPLTATGKADYAAVRVLVEQDAAPAPDSGAGATPAPASESGVTDASSGSVADQLLAEVGQLLGRPGTTPHEDLFHAGLTSLDAVRLASRITVRTGAHITAADVYRQRTLDKLLTLSGDREQSADVGPGSLDADHGDAPLSRAQERFWLSEEFTPGDADNVVVLAYALKGSLDTERFEAALGRVIARHPVLRTVYPYEGAGAVQRVLPADDIRVALERTSAPHHAGGDDLRELAEEISADWWGGATDLEKEPPLRLRLCRVDEQTHLFCMRVHHLAFDGWSETLFMEDLAAAMDPEVSLAEPPRVTYAGYGKWERDRLDTWLGHDLPYWQEALKDAPRPFLPRPSEGTQARRVESVLPVSAEVVARLTHTADTFGGTPVAALLAAAGRSLSRVFGVEDLCLGTVSTGRHSPELESIVGCFVNSLPIALTSVSAQDATELLATCARTVASGFQHARTPFDELVRSLQPKRDRHPWFQVWVILQRQPPRVRLGAGVTAEALRIRPPHTGFELLIEAVPQPGGGWELVVSRRADGMSEAEAERLLDQLTDCLEELSAAA